MVALAYPTTKNKPLHVPVTDHGPELSAKVKW